MRNFKYLTFICAFVLTSLASAAETDPNKGVDPQERKQQLENRIQEI